MNDLLVHEIRGASVTTVTSISTLVLTEVLRRTTSLPREVTRKFAHAACGAIVVALPWLMDSHWTVLFVSACFAGIMLATDRMGVLEGVHGVGRGTGGVLWYPLAAWLAYVLAFEVFETSRTTYVIAVLVLALADTAGAIVGKRWGRHQYRVGPGHVRSVEGSAAVAATTFAVVWLPLVISGATDAGRAAGIALGAAVVMAALEAVSRWGADNLVLPVGALLFVHWSLRMSDPVLATTAGSICVLGAALTLVALVSAPTRTRVLPGRQVPLPGWALRTGPIPKRMARAVMGGGATRREDDSADSARSDKVVT